MQVLFQFFFSAMTRNLPLAQQLYERTPVHARQFAGLTATQPILRVERKRQLAAHLFLKLLNRQTHRLRHRTGNSHVYVTVCFHDNPLTS